MSIKLPQIAVPDFWLANFGKVQDYLRHRLRSGQLHEIGQSSLGYPLSVVEYPRAGCPKLLVIGGTHGHEPGTVASAMNLIHLMETPADLAGRPHGCLLDLLQQVHLFVVPCLNPDGRTVCPDSFYAQGIDTVTIYSSGLRQDGELVPYDADSEEPLYYFDPRDALFVGGQFNGAGYAINRRRSPDASDAVEVQALFEFTRDQRLEAAIDLHACGYNFGMQVRSHAPPYWPVVREWQRRAETLFAQKGRPLGALYGDGDPPPPLTFHFNASLFHRHARMLFMAFEGRQGYFGRSSFMPLPSEWVIIDDYLSAVQVFLELGAEGWYARAKREAFGQGGD